MMDRPSIVNPSTPTIKSTTSVTFNQVMSYISMLDRMEQTEEVVEAKKKALKAMDRFLFPPTEINVPELLPSSKKTRWFS